MIKQKHLGRVKTIFACNDTLYGDALPILKTIAGKLDLPAVYNAIGVLHANNEDYDEAGDAYRKAIEKAPQYSPVQFNLGLLKERQGKSEEASRHFGK